MYSRLLAASEHDADFWYATPALACMYRVRRWIGAGRYLGGLLSTSDFSNVAYRFTSAALEMEMSLTS